MKTHHFKKIILFSMLLGLSQVSWAACTQTLSPGANVATAVSGAAAGSTICLNSGSYGSVSLNNIVKTSDVIVQSVSGNTASLSLSIGNGSNHLKFQNLTILGMNISGGTTKNITVARSTLTSQLVVNTINFNNNNILIDGNTFDAINANGGYEGRLQISWGNGPGTVPAGVVVTNNHFGNLGCSDGIQIGSYGVVVGPGNVFENIQQGSCVEHVDSIQLYGQSHTTINGNYFKNVTVCLGAYDGGNTETITNNTFIGTTGGECIVYLASINNMMLSHNTFNNASTLIGAGNNPAGTTGSILNNNFLLNSYSSSNGAGFTGTIDHNLFTSSSLAKGSNTTIGTPTFVGGATPSTWAGFQLTSSSLGYHAATDGNDLGTNLYGTGTTLTQSTTSILLAPSNLRVN